MSTPAFTLRPIVSGDTPFLQQLYASTRDDLALVPHWTEQQKQLFCHMQFSAQHHHYMQHFPRASYSIVEVGGQPVGRWYVDPRDGALHVLDVALLPTWRRRGIGGQLMRGLMDKAAASGMRVSLYVYAEGDPARRFYRRLGFVEGNLDGMHLFMDWAPQEKE